MKIKEIQNWVRENYPNQNKNLEVELLIAFILEKSREYVFLNQDFLLEEIQWNKLQQYLQDLFNGKPIEQILGYKEFYGNKLIVTENVLLPRPESELLVDLAKAFIETNFADQDIVQVLDVGTGSGAIILSLAKACSKVQGMGVEISTEALKVAQLNQKYLNLEKRVVLQHGDLLSGLEHHSFQIILANLPYIGTVKYNFVAKDVAKFEPEIALYGGEDGLDLYRKFFDQVLLLGNLPKLIIGEFGFGQADLMESILSDKFNSDKLAGNGQAKWEILPDLAGIPRVFMLKFE